jgi:hypothetical protein
MSQIIRNQNRAYVFEVNPKKDFVKIISKHEDKLSC